MLRSPYNARSAGDAVLPAIHVQRDGVLRRAGRIGQKHDGRLESFDLVQIHHPHNGRRGRGGRRAVVLLGLLDQPAQLRHEIRGGWQIRLRGAEQLDGFAEAAGLHVAAGRSGSERRETEIGGDAFDGDDRREIGQPVGVPGQAGKRVAEQLSRKRFRDGATEIEPATRAPERIQLLVAEPEQLAAQRGHHRRPGCRVRARRATPCSAGRVRALH